MEVKLDTGIDRSVCSEYLESAEWVLFEQFFSYAFVER